MNRISTRLIVALVALFVVLGVVTPASAGANPYCGISWGSRPKVSSAADTETLVNIRAGRHACFDRLVIDLAGQEDATFGTYDVRYVPVVREDGSGNAVPVRGAADLQVVMGAAAYSDGTATYTPANRREVVNVSGYSTFRQVAWAGSFEGQTTLALGVRAQLPFRVFVLNGTPNSGHIPRLVIDVAHRW